MADKTDVRGLTGSITIGDLDQFISAINLNTGKELLDVSAYGGNGWRKRVGGLKDLSGTCVAFMSKGASGSNPFTDTNGSMTIEFDTGCSITFQAVIGQVQVAGEYQGLNVITFAFSKSDDAEPTIVWDESGGGSGI